MMSLELLVKLWAWRFCEFTDARRVPISSDANRVTVARLPAVDETPIEPRHEATEDELE